MCQDTKCYYTLISFRPLKYNNCCSCLFIIFKTLCVGFWIKSLVHNKSVAVSVFIFYTYWHTPMDSNHDLPVLETDALPVKLDVYMAHVERFELSLTLVRSQVFYPLNYTCIFGGGARTCTETRTFVHYW